jgi:integration host factor subunit beta
MTRTQLIAELAKCFPQLTHLDVDVSVKAILEALRDHLAAGERIELRGFGVFTLQERAPRKGRNPRMGGLSMYQKN